MPIEKKQRGGKREGAGAKPRLLKLRILKIACTEEELAQILKAIKDTRRRAAILLEAARTEGKTYDAI